MSRLRIYGVARTRAFRVLWAAMELGLDYEHIPVAQILNDLLEGAVLQIAILPAQDEQAGARPIRLGMLGYELLWQGIIELFCLQAHKRKLIL